MLEKAMKKVLTFLEFSDQQIIDIDYMISQSEKFGIKDKVKNQIDSFNPSPDELYPVYYKRMFLSEFAWTFCELVCGEYYPEIAVTQLEEFCLYHHDEWTSREDYNPYYNWFLQNDMRKMTKRQAVEKNFKDLEYHYQKYFTNNGRERLFEKGLI